MKRNRIIDIVKGLLIIFVVLAHSEFQYKEFITLFHMAAFFMVSGYLFQETNTDSFLNLKAFVIRKIKKIWFPCFVWSVIFVLCNNLFIDLNIYAKNEIIINGIHYTAAPQLSSVDQILQIIKSIFFKGRTQMGGTFWYFMNLFGISIFHAIVDYVLKKNLKKENQRNMVHIILGILLLIVSYLCQRGRLELLGIPVIFKTYLFYEIAVLFRKYEIMEKIKYHLLCIIISACILFAGNQFGTVSFGSSDDAANPVFLIIVSLAGWCLVYAMAVVCAKFRWSEALVFLGRNSLCIMILHFLCFKAVTLLQIVIYSEPMENLAAFPVLHMENFWWAAYLAAGILLPIGLNHVYHMGINKIRQLKGNRR